MKEYNRTFIKNEFKSILGKRFINFWILLAVFLFSIGSLCISSAGLEFLRQKMEDPFINWIDVHNNPNLDEFFSNLEKQEIKDKFGYSTIEKNVFMLEYVFTSEHKKLRVEGRTIEDKSQLLTKILSHDNVIVKRENPITKNDYGLVVTQDLMERLGYGKIEKYPLFINLTKQVAVPMLIKDCGLCGHTKAEIDTTKLKELGITDFDTWQEIPIPIIAVVKQLPDVLDFLATPYFSEQLEAGEASPFNINMHPNYLNRIQFILQDGDEENAKTEIASKFQNINIEWENTVDFNLAFKVTKLLSAIVRDTSISKEQLNNLCNSVVENSRNTKIPIYRFYDYEFCKGIQLNTDYISIMFDNLINVKAFQLWAKDEFNIRIDMAQIDAKENFQTFNNLAIGLSAAIITISIIFLIIFLYFLINSHFQKISKNLGTIIAFGLDNRSIIEIYLAVFMKLIFISLFVAVTLLGIMQFLLHMVNIGYSLNGMIMPYMNMLDWLVLAVLLGILVLSTIVTFIIMNKKIQKSTPGDLIYERIN